MAPRKKTDRASVQKAANAAEKRAAKAKKADTVKAPDGTNDTDSQNRALFLHHLPKIADLKDKVATATANLRNAYKTAKADGFLKDDFDIAFEIQGADGEKKKKAAIARSLQIAKWLGCDLGAQLDLFVADPLVPAEDRAYEEGKTDALLNKAAKPSYDPSVPQYKRYMEGYHSVSEARINNGIKPLKKDVEAKAEIETQKAKDAKAFDAPSSGTPITRAEYERQAAETVN